jgi:holliday junction DNA helicase RuvA
MFPLVSLLVYNSNMIRSVTGTITATGEHYVVAEVQQLGYLIHTPTNRYQYVPGETLTFYTYLVVRENALDLYGFQSELERSFFELLLDVPKIGPKSALQIMTQADPGLLSSAILEEDPELLTKQAGVGRKTAQNLVSHLSGKIDHLTLPAHLSPIGTTLSATQLDAIDALITLGYDPKEARAYVQKQDTTKDTKSLVQEALKQMPIP